MTYEPNILSLNNRMSQTNAPNITPYTFGQPQPAAAAASIFNMLCISLLLEYGTKRRHRRVMCVPDVHVNQIIFRRKLYTKICQQEKFRNNVGLKWYKLFPRAFSVLKYVLHKHKNVLDSITSKTYTNQNIVIILAKFSKIYRALRSENPFGQETPRQ